MTTEKSLYQKLFSRSQPPVLDVLTPEQENLFDSEKLNRQWLLFTEAVRQEIVTDPRVTAIVSRFINIPVDETLAHQLLVALSTGSERVAKIAERWDESLGAYCALPSVPDDQIRPDISNAQLWWRRPGATLDERGLTGDPLRGSWGITDTERTLVTTRYRFARDVKILALMAVMVFSESTIPEDSTDTILPSGVEITIDKENAAAQSELLDPRNWERRKRIKDRVYEISVAGKKYILKERKTARHTDTKRDGHIDGNTSKEEIVVARRLHSEGAVDTHDYTISWEAPLGCVTFPDGFQFAIFEFIAELASQQNNFLAKPAAFAKVLANPDYFAEEFESVRELAKVIDKHLDEKTVAPNLRENRTFMNFVIDAPVAPFVSSFLAGYPDWKKHKAKVGDHDLTYEEFAHMKGNAILVEAEESVTAIQGRLGFINSDRDGHAILLNDKSDPRIHLACFDFEYMRQGGLDNVEEVAALNRKFLMRNFCKSLDKMTTRMEKAAWIALMVQKGLVALEDVIGSNV